MLQKIENYAAAVERLGEAVDESRRNPDSSVVRDGVIQRFEFTFELAWKSLKDYMEDQGLNLPAPAFSKQVFKAAYAGQIIHDEAVWLRMLDARNLTSHVYDEKTAADILRMIGTEFLPALQALSLYYRQN